MTNKTREQHLFEQIEHLTEQLQSTRDALIRSEADKRVAQTQAQERQVTIEVQRTAMRLLEAAKPSTEHVQLPEPTTLTELQPQRRSWWPFR